MRRMLVDEGWEEYSGSSQRNESSKGSSLVVGSAGEQATGDWNLMWSDFSIMPLVRQSCAEHDVRRQFYNHFAKTNAICLKHELARCMKRMQVACHFCCLLLQQHAHIF
jgi:hypothetical protein